jgi:hypothetical protein
MTFNFSNYDISSNEAQEIVSAVAGALLVTAIVALLLGIVLYVIKSLGLYTIAKRRGIACPWLAWLPVGCEWIAGSIADQYRKVTSGKATVRRFIIVALAVISIGLTCFTTTTLSSKADEIDELTEYVEEHGEDLDEEEALEYVTEVFDELGEILGGFTLVAALSGVVALASNVYWFVCAGDVYASCCPKNGTMMLVLSFFLPILAPFFFFCNKEKDAGMVPVNKPQPQYVAPVEPAAPVYEAPAQQPVYEAPAAPVYEAPAQTPVEPWTANDTHPEPWENPEN